MSNGKGGAKRHRKVLRGNIQKITKTAIRRLARRGGVTRLSGVIYEESRGEPPPLRRSPRKRSWPALPTAFRELFFTAGRRKGAVLRRHGRTLTLLHSAKQGRPGSCVWHIHDFLTPGELTHLDHIITAQKRSSKSYTTDTDQVPQQDRPARVSLNKCQDARIRTMEQRAAQMVGLPSQHVEPLQIISYRDGQYFHEHHDMGPIDAEGKVVEPIVGPDLRRLVTLFVYLNTLPQGQGHTEMTRMRGVSMRPRQGHALFFCNVDADGQPDPMAAHKACPVRAPHVKYGINIFLTDTDLQGLALLAEARGKKKTKKQVGGKKGPTVGVLGMALDGCEP